MKAFAAMNEGVLTVKITGELDVTSVAGLRAILDPVVDQAPDGLVVDMADVRLIDSSGVGVLVYLYRRVSASGRPFAVRGATQQPLSILRLMKLDHLFMRADGDC